MLLKISSKARKVAIAAAGATALTAVALTGAASATAKAVPNGTHFGHPMVHGNLHSSLACANAGGDDSGIAIVSQNFLDSGFDIYDAQGADDFKVTAKCTINTVTAVGVYFNGAGLAKSENVIVYKNTNGAPGAVVAKYKKVHGADNGTGTFTITLPTALTLKPNKYWLSVQANMAYASGGEWGWEMTATTQNGSASVWQNPGDGLGTGCTSWTTTTTCIPDGEGPDFLFTLG